MQLTENIRKYILLGIVGFIVAGIIAAKVMASNQDNQFSTNEMLYHQVSQLYSEGNTAEAVDYMNMLMKNQPKSEVVNYLGGLIAAHNGEYMQAANLMQKTLDLNPYKVEDAMFMLQFAEVLYFTERYEDAQLVLEHCQQEGWAPEEYPTYQERVTELLTEIENI